MLKEDMLKKIDLKTEIVNIPEWGGDVVVTELTGAEREKWELAVNETVASKRVNLRAKMVVASVVDAAGNRIFSYEDVPAISALPYRILEKVCEVAVKLNGIAPGEIEKAEKN